MLIEHSGRSDIDGLANELAGVGRASSVLFTKVLEANPRLLTLRSIGKTRRLDHLLDCEAWAEAAIELVALEAPDWHVKRLCLDDHDWLCTLTRFPDVPDWLDDSTEGRHPVLGLAILDALLGIRARAATNGSASHRSIDPARPVSG